MRLRSLQQTHHRRHVARAIDRVRDKRRDQAAVENRQPHGTGVGVFDPLGEGRAFGLEAAQVHQLARPIVLALRVIEVRGRNGLEVQILGVGVLGVTVDEAADLHRAHVDRPIGRGIDLASVHGAGGDAGERAHGPGAPGFVGIAGVGRKRPPPRAAGGRVPLVGGKGALGLVEAAKRVAQRIRREAAQRRRALAQDIELARKRLVEGEKVVAPALECLDYLCPRKRHATSTRLSPLTLRT